jgi:DNA-binding transcriptional LysR family regulator
MISLRQIEVIRAVLLTRAISGAAAMLNVSPAAVSRMLKHTESQIGYQLFSRGPQGFVATPEAADLLDELEEVHIRLKRIQDRLQQGQMEERSIRIGASPGLGLSLVPKALARMKHVDPTFQFELDVLHIDEIVPHLEVGECDFALTIFEVGDPRVQCRKLAEAELICLVGEAHQLANHSSVSLQELARNDLVGFDRSSFQQRMIDQLFADQSLAPRYRARARLMVTACALVREGLGATLLDAFTVFGEAPTGTRAVSLEQTFRFPLNVITSRKSPLSQTSHAFLITLQKLLADENSPLVKIDRADLFSTKAI